MRGGVGAAVDAQAPEREPEADGGEDILRTGNIAAGNEDMLAELTARLKTASA